MSDLSRLRFTPSRPLTLGVELELQIVDLQHHDLTPRSAALLQRMAATPIPGRVTHEITASMLELCTGVCASHAEVQRTAYRLFPMALAVRWKAMCWRRKVASPSTFPA